MVLTGTSVKLVDPRDLLVMLRQQPLAAPFNLTLYSARYGRKGIVQAIQAVCSPFDGAQPCFPDCCRSWETSFNQALQENQPVVRACPQGLLYFIVPLPRGQGLPDLLIGAASCRLETTASATPELTAGGKPAPASGLSMRSISPATAEAASAELFLSLPQLLEQKLHTLSLARTTQRLEAVQKLGRDLADCRDSEQALSLVGEALVVLFDLPRLLILLQQAGPSMRLQAALGLAPETFQFDQKSLLDYLAKSSPQPEILSGDDLASLFPGLETTTACLFPLIEDDRRLGAIVAVDVDLHSRDQALIGLLAGRLASRLASLQSAAQHRQERQFSARLVAMISALSLINSRQELYLQILEMSAELLTATSGSLMLLDESEGTLKIATAKGMTSSLARVMAVPFGEGIAGRVAKSGFPLLVNDIERDQRVAARNRPRFKTKSFVSLPLECQQRLIGVLNLADKSNGATFSEADLNLVQTFTGHAVLMIERAAALEKAGQFEALAITDPLTGLYNRRFLADRLQQEFSRSERQQQNFCIVMADLDSFKIYNDICGHLAGDQALRKVAKVMRRSAREMDIVTRYGGEEFCLILPGTAKKESVFVAERMRRAIEVESFPGESHLPLGRLTISLGIAAFPVDGVTTDALLHAADLALYRAKSLGRNRLVLYEPALDNQPLVSQQR